MRKTLWLATAALVLVLMGAGPALAQDGKVTNEEFGVEIQKPKDWQSFAGNEKAVAVFQHPVTQSQIEIVPTKLMTPDVADVFFSTFHKTLTESSFEQEEQKKEKIGDYEGTTTTYKFTHAGVTLQVMVFQFVRESTAWIVVGYLQSQSPDIAKLREGYRWTIQKIDFPAAN